VVNSEWSYASISRCFYTAWIGTTWSSSCYRRSDYVSVVSVTDLVFQISSAEKDKCFW